jgi:stearoyl-CoA desaturase (delta-9 desaturase)
VAAILAAHVLASTALVTETRRADWIAFGIFCVLISLAVGAGLHRYFAHRAFKTSRAFQFALGVLGSAFFGDPVGFAGKHRLHHRYSDTDRDPHSPRRGAWHCWLGHLVDDGCSEEQVRRAVPDLTRFPELMWLHRFFYLPGVATVALVAAFGGYSMLAAGYAVSWCLMAFHGPALVNYFCHHGGPRRYEIPDRSANNVVLGVLLLGEGWHNNHHRFPRAARAGFRWYELDLLFYGLKMLSWVGLVWDLREVPPAIRRAGREGTPCASR